MRLSVAGREKIKTVGSKSSSKTFVGDHSEKYWGVRWDGMGLKMRSGNWAGNGGFQNWALGLGLRKLALGRHWSIPIPKSRPRRNVFRSSFSFFCGSELSLGRGLSLGMGA